MILTLTEFHQNGLSVFNLALTINYFAVIPGMNFPEVPNVILIDKMYRMTSQFAKKEGHNFREVA